MREDSFPLAREETEAPGLAWLGPGLRAGIWHWGGSTVPPFLVREKQPPGHLLLQGCSRPPRSHTMRMKRRKESIIVFAPIDRLGPLCAVTPGKAPPQESPPCFPRSL